MTVGGGGRVKLANCSAFKIEIVIGMNEFLYLLLFTGGNLYPELESKV